MQDDVIEGMVIAHDKHLDSLASSVESLAKSVGGTNKKLDDIIEVISTQNVMVERINNMDINIREFAVEIRKKVSGIEQAQTDISIMNTKLSGLDRSVDNIRGDVEALEVASEDTVNKYVLMWGIGVLVSIVLAAASIVNTNIHDVKLLANGNKVLVEKEIATHAEVKESLKDRLTKVESSLVPHIKNEE